MLHRIPSLSPVIVRLSKINASAENSAKVKSNGTVSSFSSSSAGFRVGISRNAAGDA
jgi:hypothetical protein